PPQTALTQPPKTILCPHSHTPTHPPFPPIPFPIPTTHLQHLFPTQTLSQTKPKNFKININPSLPPPLYPKHIILYLI
ncbi:aconitase family protein, partial [Staphylococcus epidermidis]|uniref:aconitase family protein n=1 Tax=Staphylococcus epidermidis TaxID=1282 RepID=UPI0021B22132